SGSCVPQHEPCAPRPPRRAATWRPRACARCCCTASPIWSTSLRIGHRTAESGSGQLVEKEINGGNPQAVVQPSVDRAIAAAVEPVLPGIVGPALSQNALTV